MLSVLFITFMFAGDAQAHPAHHVSHRPARSHHSRAHHNLKKHVWVAAHGKTNGRWVLRSEVRWVSGHWIIRHGRLCWINGRWIVVNRH